MEEKKENIDAFNEVFQTLSAINVNGHTEKKKTGSTELTYLSWAWAWGELMKVYPDATYEVTKYGPNQQPYFYDPVLGYMCHTTMRIKGIEREMWLPVMDGANNAMKSQPYTIKTKYGGDKYVAAASMFDINKTIMRCLVKNIGMFGLGLYIYAGEDLPETEQSANNTNAEAKTTTENPIRNAGYSEQVLNEALLGVANAKTIDKLIQLWEYYSKSAPSLVAQGTPFYNAWLARRSEFQNQKA